MFKEENKNVIGNKNWEEIKEDMWLLDSLVAKLIDWKGMDKISFKIWKLYQQFQLTKIAFYVKKYTNITNETLWFQISFFSFYN